LTEELIANAQFNLELAEEARDTLLKKKLVATANQVLILKKVEEN
jgi:hypothetical protein